MAKMTRTSIGKEHAKCVGVAHADLNLFAAIELLADSSLISSEYYGDCQAIVRITQRAQQKCLRQHDSVLAKID